MEKTRFAIIGAGNGGHAYAAHLTLLGFTASLYDIDPARVAAMLETGVIKASGAVQGEAKIPLITNNIGDAIKDADIIMVVVPAVYHGGLAQSMAEFLRDGQIIVVNPGATGGALEVKSVLAQANCPAKVILGETSTILYACRSPQPGEVIIGGLKVVVDLATIPSNQATRVAAMINMAFPQFRPVPNIIYTSINNVNAMMHPGPTLLNAGRVESMSPFFYYSEGVTPAVAKVVERLDAERLQIGKQLGANLISVDEWYTASYGVSGDCLYNKVQKVKAYEGIKGPTNINTRYIFEDIPTGLVPLSAIGKAVGVATPAMDSVIELCSTLLQRDFRSEGRSLERLGLAGKNREELIELLAQ